MTPELRSNRTVARSMPWRLGLDEDAADLERFDPLALGRCGRPGVDEPNDAFGGFAGDRDGAVVVDHHRQEAGLDEVAAGHHHAQDRGRERGEEVLVEHQVAEAVGDQVAAVPLDTLQHVGVVGDHHVGAGVDGGLRDPAQERALDLGELEAAVELGDDDVGAFVAQPLDLGRPSRVPSTGLRRRGPAGRPSPATRDTPPGP